MRNIEDVVRQSLRDQVLDQPPMDRSADRAIVGAGVVRRRRSLLGAGLALLVLAAAVSGIAVLRGPGTHPTLPPVTTPTTTPSATLSKASPAGVTLLVDRRELLLPDGHAISLAQVDGGALSAYQTRDGWLVSGYGNGVDTLSLWLAKPDGSMRRLVDRSDAPVAVAADGRRFAWRSSGQLIVGHLAADATVVVDQSTVAPTRGAPLALTGTVVLLGYSSTGGGVDNYDVWLPQHGAYSPSWDRMTHVRAVYGPTPDSQWLLGLVRGPAGGKDTCLAQLDPANALRAVATACGLSHVLDSHGPVSPDGRWLALQSADANGHGQVALVDLTSVFQQTRVVATWDAETPGVWVDATGMVASGRDGRVLMFRIGRATPEPVTVTGLRSGVPFELVPRLP